MINISIYLALFLLAPMVSFAQSSDYSETTAILMLYSLGSAILIGAVTSIIVLVNGRRMRGGIFGKTLTYFGIGMLVILVGSTFMLFPEVMPDYMKSSLPSILNTIGYVIIAIAANRLLKVTQK